MNKAIFFNTITQYDKSLYNVWDYKNNKCTAGLACPFFALLSAQQFLEDYENITYQSYLDSLHKSIYINKMLNIQKEISFSKLLSYTNINKDEINIAIANEIENGNFDFKNILTESKYCSYIFLKNSKFFTVLIDKKYHIRDCHESTQYTFDHVDDLINHLNSVYQFNKRIIIDNIPYDEYSTIEYIKIIKKIITPFDDNKKEKENIIIKVENNKKSKCKSNPVKYLEFDIKKLESF